MYGHLDGRVRRLRAARLEVGIGGTHVRRCREELVRVDEEFAVTDAVVVIAFCAAIIGGLIIVVETIRAWIVVIIICALVPQRQFGLVRRAGSWIVTRVRVRLTVLTLGRR